MQKQWVVCLTGELGHRQGGGVGEPVTVPDDELLEAVAGVEGTWEIHLRVPAGSVSRGGVSVQARKYHPDPSAGDALRAGVENAPKTFGDPRPGGRRSLHDEDIAVPCFDFEGSKPDLVRGLSDDPPEFGADLAPGRGEFRVHGQLQATPSWEREG